MTKKQLGKHKRKSAVTHEPPRGRLAPTKGPDPPKPKRAKKAVGGGSSSSGGGGGGGGKANKIGGKTLEQHRRAMGDRVKGSIRVEKWCIAASTHAVLDDVDPAVFRALVVPHAASVVPPAFGDGGDGEAPTPVVVASVRGTAAMGEIFGHSKIKGGTRMGSWAANKGELVYFPEERSITVLSVQMMPI